MPYGDLSGSCARRVAEGQSRPALWPVPLDVLVGNFVGAALIEALPGNVVFDLFFS